MGDKCNRNNFFKEGDRSSTKTHHHMASHHSKSSWSMGWSEPEPAAAAKPKAQPPAQVQSQAQAPEKTVAPVKEQAAAPMTDATNMPGRGTSANRFATGSNQNCGNVITDRPTTRIHAPPGGRSNIFFG